MEKLSSEKCPRGKCSRGGEMSKRDNGWGNVMGGGGGGGVNCMDPDKLIKKIVEYIRE